MKAITVKRNGIISPDADILGLVDDWRAHLELQVESREISELTYQSYLRGWAKFQSWMLAQGIVLVDGEIIRSWLRDLNKAGHKPNSVNVWFAGVRSFFTWSVSNHRLMVNPCEKIKGSGRKGTSRKHLRSPLTSAEIRGVLSRPDRSTALGKRDYAILAVMVYTGVRTVEIVRADLMDLKTKGTRLVLYVQGKGKIEKDEFVVIPGPAEDALHDWLAVRGDRPGPLFASLSNRSSGDRLTSSAVRHLIKEYFKGAGVSGEEKTTHSLRHTAITNAVIHGVPFQKVQSMARHENSNTTMIYYHEVDRLEDPAEDYINYDMRAKY